MKILNTKLKKWQLNYKFLYIKLFKNFLINNLYI